MDAMNPLARPLLVELLTEELPPRALRALGESFAQGVADGLRARGLAGAGARVEPFATPRRLAVRIEGVLAQAPERGVEAKGPSVKVALDAVGQPTQALLKWAERQGARLDQLVRASDGKQECFFYRSTLPGESLAQAIEPVLQATLDRLPIPKLMQYQLADGHTTVSFVRPAHKLVVLHGAEVLACSVLGLQAGRETDGHRFLGEHPIVLDDAAGYEQVLRERGRVVASFAERRSRIEAALLAEAQRLGARLAAASGSSAPGASGTSGTPGAPSTSGTSSAFDASDAEALAGELTGYVDEVTALVEWPRVYVGGFEPEFLAVPQECLILTMRTNQKYFPLFDEAGRLRPQFLIVSNMDVADPTDIVDGNERVVRPRLADARFFYEQDKKVALAARVEALRSVVYHAKLGSQFDRMQRVRRIARAIAQTLAASAAPAERADDVPQPGCLSDCLTVTDALVPLAQRAAELAKADLLTGMVGEFPELQGIMGRYYARHDGEPAEVADAIAEHYQPRFAGDALPASAAGTVLALADKLETLAGIWGIGAQPSGDRDPFALRRHALGVVRMLVEKHLPLPLGELVAQAFAAFEDRAGVAADADGLQAFMVERLRGYLRERGFAPADIEAALAVDASALHALTARLEAIAAFGALPEAAALAAANKRIGNILRKSAADLLAEAERQPDGAARDAFVARVNTDAFGRRVEAAIAAEPAEQALAESLERVGRQARERFDARDYAGSLTELAALREPVDAFFDRVMVMADDPVVREHRLALLLDLHTQMNRVADLSRLAA